MGTRVILLMWVFASALLLAQNDAFCFKNHLENRAIELWGPQTCGQRFQGRGTGIGCPFGKTATPAHDTICCDEPSCGAKENPCEELRFLYRVGKGGWAAGEQEYSITIKSGDTVTWVARYVDNNAGSGHRYFTSSSDCK
jgi:hypothetical protein